ncbi:MAG: DUF711 family protein [Anaerolineae bacterium]|nr:DUF711 family protein [Anaerolineae bacterium]
MKIRSITLFADLAGSLDEDQIDHLGSSAKRAAAAYADAGYEVQTIRLATSLLTSHNKPPDPVAAAIAVEAQCRRAGFEFVSLGPASPRNLSYLPEILRATQNLFATCHVVEPGSQTIDGANILKAADVIREASKIDDGFGNLRFAALANVAPGIPFFPAAYSAGTGGSPAFAIATQSADLAVAATTESATAAEASARLRNLVHEHAQRMEATAREIAGAHQLRFLGTDFSLAPFPGSRDSIGGALEALTGRPLGAPGTLAAAALLTSAIQEAVFQHAGFCGMMLPVLEDSILAQRAAEGYLRIPELLQWSAVCGTGLDTVPIPGDASREALAGLLYDVAALAVRLDKPLTARLMPLPGKAAGDPVHFDFAYFADGGVLPLGEGAANALTATRDLALSRYRSSQE